MSEFWTGFFVCYCIFAGYFGLRFVSHEVKMCGAFWPGVGNTIIMCFFLPIACIAILEDFINYEESR